MIIIRLSRRSKYSWWRIIFLVCSFTAYSVLKSVYGLPMSSSPNQQTGSWICCSNHSTKAMKKQICTFFKFPNNRKFSDWGIVLHIKTAPERFCPSAVPTYRLYYIIWMKRWKRIFLNSWWLPRARRWSSRMRLRSAYYHLRKVRERCLESEPAIVPVAVPRSNSDIRIEKNDLQISQQILCLH